jgi:glutathione S-transferase
MQLFVSPLAPNALRVMMLIKEKKLDVPLVNVDLGSEERKTAYGAINPLMQVPALELDDGTHLSESLIICQYLDEISGPPLLFGETLEVRSQIAMWERRAEFGLFIPAVEYGHHTHPMFGSAFKQFPDWAETMRAKAAKFYTIMGEQLSVCPYLGGSNFSIADVTSFIGHTVAMFFGIPVPENASIQAWHKRVNERDSARDLFLTGR